MHWISLSLSLSLLLSLGYVIEKIMQVLAADRLSELHEAQEDNIILSKQLQDLQVCHLNF